MGRAIYSAGAPDPRADLMLALLEAFDEFERAIVRERQTEGIARSEWVALRSAASSDRVQQATNRHRDRSDDPLYGIRMTLNNDVEHGAEMLTDRPRARLWRAFFTRATPAPVYRFRLPQILSVLVRAGYLVRLLDEPLFKSFEKMAHSVALCAQVPQILGGHGGGHWYPLHHVDPPGA